MRFKPGLVSVVIPMHNVYPYIEKTLESVVNQTYRPIEVIVVDDKSTDQSEMVAEEYARKYKFIKIVKTPEDKWGLPVARNTGMRHARGEFIVFLDGDDYWEPDFIEKCVDKLRNIPRTVFCASASIDELPEGIKVVISQKVEYPSLVDYFSRRVRLSIPLMVFSHRFLKDNIIIFRESQKVVEDTPFVVEIFAKGGIGVTIPEVLFHHVRRSSSITSSNEHFHIYQLKVARIVEKLVYSSENIIPDEKRKILNALWNFHIPFSFIMTMNKISNHNRKEGAKFFIKWWRYIIRFRPRTDYYSALVILNFIDTFVPIKSVIKNVWRR